MRNLTITEIQQLEANGYTLVPIHEGLEEDYAQSILASSLRKGSYLTLDGQVIVRTEALETSTSRRVTEVYPIELIDTLKK